MTYPSHAAKTRDFNPASCSDSILSNASDLFSCLFPGLFIYLLTYIAVNITTEWMPAPQGMFNKDTLRDVIKQDVKGLDSLKQHRFTVIQ